MNHANKDQTKELESLIYKNLDKLKEELFILKNQSKITTLDKYKKYVLKTKVCDISTGLLQKILFDNDIETSIKRRYFDVEETRTPFHQVLVTKDNINGEKHFIEPTYCQFLTLQNPETEKYPNDEFISFPESMYEDVGFFSLNFLDSKLIEEYKKHPILNAKISQEEYVHSFDNYRSVLKNMWNPEEYVFIRCPFSPLARLKLIENIGFEKYTDYFCH